jgi:hypothetical protein
MITEQTIELSPEESRKLNSTLSASKQMISNFKNAYHDQKLKELKEATGPAQSQAHQHSLLERFLILVDFNPPTGIWFYS